MDKTFIKHIYELLPGVLEVAEKPVWFDYDRKADVLYVSFRKPQDATETIPFDEHVLMRKRENELVGLTILNVSKMSKTKSAQ